ncbi:MAG: TIGR03982 family His-Xaa-Ser system protein [Novosphingobium sp.]|nr:TIGR03982 family His-Xaa-Ser system protein [Novosphingobium sp.]
MALGVAGLPVWREILILINQSEYGKLVEMCDGAMRDHYQAKIHAADNPSRDSGLKLHSAEVGLLVCQDYDLYQKSLTQWGLTENELSRMRLTAIEERASDLDEVIATHEIRY